MKINKKKLMLFGLPILCLALVAAVLTYYGVFTVTLSVNQPIEVVGPLEQSFDCGVGEICTGASIRINNDGNKDLDVFISNDFDNEDITLSYVGKLILSSKDPTTWEINPDGEQASLTYTVVGDKFEYTLTTLGISSGLEGNEDYVLIYYADQPDRFVNWGGAPAFELGILPDGENTLSGSVNVINLPFDTDWNGGSEADYTQSPDFYAHAKGAKIWLIPVSDYNGVNEVLSAWNPSKYLFETDLIYYFANSEGKITVPANSFIQIAPQFKVDQYASDWSGTITTTIA